MVIFLRPLHGRGSSCSRSIWRNSRRKSAVVSLWVVNASPIILLSKINHINLLNQLGAPVIIPEAAALEVQRRGPSDPAVQALTRSPWLATIDPGPIAPAVAVENLGLGESAVRTHALAIP